ncbi:hypothetical protein Tco_1193957 [Tanacetum coccineum]
MDIRYHFIKEKVDNGVVELYFKCLVDVEVFRQALDIFPRVPKKEFIVPPSEKELLTFLIELGYKGELTHLPQIFIDYMHQPFGDPNHPIINKFLFRKTTRNDRLRQSRVAIIWGMFHKKYVDFAELIWEDFSYQIDYMLLKKSRCEIMPYTGFTKIIINHFLSFHKFVPKALPFSLHTMKDDGGHEGKKSVVTPKLASVEVFDKSDAKPAKRQFGRRRMSKKKALISTDDNIIPEPDVALELEKYMSLAEVAEEEAARQVHATHERICVKKESPDPSRESVKGIQTLIVRRTTICWTRCKSLNSPTKTLAKSSHMPRLQREGPGTKPGFLISQRLTSLPIISELDSVLKPGFQMRYKNESDENDEVDNTGKGDEEITDTAKAYAEKIEEVKDNNKKDKIPPSSSSLCVSSGFGNQFLNLSSDKSTVRNLKNTADAEINSLLDDQIQQEIPHIQSPSILIVPILVILEPTVLSPIPEIPTKLLQQLFNLLHLCHSLHHQRVYVLEKDFQELKEVDHTTTILASLRSEIPSAVNAYLRSSLGDALQKAKESLSEENSEKKDHDGDDKDEDPSVRPNQGKKTKRRRTKGSESSKKTSTAKETSKGNALTKGSKSDKSVHAKELVAKPTKEVITDTLNDDVFNDVEQPQNDLAPKHNWFTQPPRPPTPDLKWNKGKAVDDTQEHTWFNDLLSAKKGPLMFDELIATPIDFSKFAMNRLKINKLTKAHLVSPVYNLLKGTCQSSIKLEYNIEECYKALSNQLDLKNLEGDHCPFDLSKPLPSKGLLDHLTIALEYFFNNDLEYLKSLDPEKKYTTSIAKTKAARYELVGIEDMIPSLWSVTKVGYDKDAERGIKHWGPQVSAFLQILDQQILEA